MLGRRFGVCPSFLNKEVSGSFHDSRRISSMQRSSTRGRETARAGLALALFALLFTGAQTEDVPPVPTWNSSPSRPGKSGTGGELVSQDAPRGSGDLGG